MNELYRATGRAKLPGSVEHLRRLLQTGECTSPAPAAAGSGKCGLASLHRPMRCRQAQPNLGARRASSMLMGHVHWSTVPGHASFCVLAL